VSALTTDLGYAAPPRRTAPPRAWQWAAALASAAAGVLHVVAAVEHREVGQLVIALFLVAALAQCGGAWLLAVQALQWRRPGRWTLVAGLAGTLALVALYVLAHTTDLLAGLTGHGTGVEAGGHGGTGDHAAAAPQGHSVATEGAVALSAEPAHVADPPGMLGTATVALELVCALGLTALLPRTWRGWALNGQLALGALVWALWLTGVLG
jgi:hypothetical protein